MGYPMLFHVNTALDTILKTSITVLIIFYRV
jgi:hypothetical protein